MKALWSNGGPGEYHAAAPAVNIRETEDEVTIEAEMVGLSRDDIRLDLEGDELRIAGKTSPECMPKEYVPVYRERVAMDYRRSFVLGSEVRKDKIDAKYEEGVLRITLKKQERPQPHRIPIE